MIGEGTHSTNQRRHSYVHDRVEVGFFTDRTVCIGCKASEVACKEWNQVPSADKHGAADRAIHEHSSGWLIRIGEILNGPLALVLRFFGLVPFAAISFLIGALVSRFGWIAVGKVSGSDPESVFAAERYHPAARL
jgi:hypothetical protein